MPGINSHIIRRQSVNLQFYKQKENFFLQEKVAALLKEKLAPALEILFNDKASSQKHIKIESLDIDLGNINAKNWEEEFVQQAVRKVRSRLDEITSLVSVEEDYEVEYVNDKPRVDKLKGGDSETGALKYFIERGLLPWNFQKINIHELLHSVLKKAAERSSQNDLEKILTGAVLSSPATLERFLLQFTKEEVGNFLEAIFHRKYNIEKATSIINVGTLHKELFSILLFFLMVDDEVIIALAKNIFRQISFTETEKKEILFQLPEVLKQLSSENAIANGQEQTEILLKELFTENGSSSSGENKNKDEDFYFIQNAGMVILHPFLEPLFAGLNLLEERKFMDTASQRKAILVSQFLVTGEMEIFEPDLLINKIICGYPLNEPVEAILELTEAEQKESTEMLNAVIEHWKALKTTSVAGLRNSFLQREGKLTEQDDYWLLQVEQKSYDVLMNFLPWGIGIIKLPWMQKRIMVEWNS